MQGTDYDGLYLVYRFEMPVSCEQRASNLHATRSNPYVMDLDFDTLPLQGEVNHSLSSGDVSIDIDAFNP